MSNLNEEREQLQKEVQLFYALERLKTNVDFQRVILKGFCEKEVINLNRLASREMTLEGKTSKSQQAQAGPVLEAYLIRVTMDGEAAREQIPELDAMIAEENQD
jgi:hypothetical protein